MIPDPNLNPDAPFDTAAQAWAWATEVLRRKRLPISSPAWRGNVSLTAAQRMTMLAEEAKQRSFISSEEEARTWHASFKQKLPHTSAERYALAQRIQAAVKALPAAHSCVLIHWAWGDWADDARLRAALAVQEKARREGKRVRLSYQYSAQQLGYVLGCSKVQAWRRLNTAMKMLTCKLQTMGVVESVKAPKPEATIQVQRVERQAFKSVA